MDDYAIPYTESMRLADAVNDADRLRFVLLPQERYVEPSAGSWYKRSVLGGWRLFTVIYGLLEKGDAQ